MYIRCRDQNYHLSFGCWNFIFPSVCAYTWGWRCVSVYWPGYLRFSTSLTTVHLLSVPDLTLLLHGDPNRLIISSSYYRGGLTSGRFRSLGYHSTTCCLWTLWRVWPSGTSVSGTLRSRLSLCSTPELPRFRYYHDISCMDLSISLCLVTRRSFSFFVTTNVLLAFNIVGKTVLLKRLIYQVLSSFVMSTAFIMIKIFLFDLIRREISASMYQYIFIVCPK